MKVWEKINELKGTDSTKEQIFNWAYMNRIAPEEFGRGLEVIEYPGKLQIIALETHNIDYDIWLEDFLNQDY